MGIGSTLRFFARSEYRDFAVSQQLVVIAICQPLSWFDLVQP
jgi:hypothetical protein